MGMGHPLKQVKCNDCYRLYTPYNGSNGITLECRECGCEMGESDAVGWSFGCCYCSNTKIYLCRSCSEK